MIRSTILLLATLVVFTNPLLGNENPSLKIDQLIANNLRAKKVAMPTKASDEVFVRRAYLDIVGRIPTYDERETFIRDPNKEALIEKLINSQGYVESMFNFYADLLRIKRKVVNNVPADTYITWIKEQIAINTHYDEFVRQLLTAEGDIYDNPAVGYYLKDEGMLLDNVANTFTALAGTNISCAQCHDHPFDEWTQMDYYNITAFFSTLNTRGLAEERSIYGKLRTEARASDERGDTRGAINRLGQWWAVGGYRNTITYDPKKVLKLPHDYKYSDAEPYETVEARTPIGQVLREGNERGTLTQDFAEWFTDDRHPTFATNIVNRLWYKAFGFKLIYFTLNDIALFDELRHSKNDELVQYLTQLIKDLDYDTREFNRILYSTRFYSSQSDDSDSFRGPKMRRMTSAQLWDSIVTLHTGDVDAWQPADLRETYRELFTTDLTSVNSTTALQAYEEWQKLQRQYYEGAPKMGREMMIRSSNIFEGSAGNFMLEFGRSDRNLIETGNEDANITQILTLMNGPLTKGLMDDNNQVIDKLADWNKDTAIEYLFASYIGRYPTEQEIKNFMDVPFADIVWVLINSHEFKLII
tara:strand:- start:2229 stop:3983 length:1755 start_codon:yes stop_codon:yes gene_type:complete